MVKKLLVSTLILGGVVLAPITASAWEAGEVDPNTPSETVKGQDGKEVTVNGWIGAWDSTDPESPDPTDPEDPTVIDITVPTTVLYANSVDDAGKPTSTIISPTYKLTNNSTSNDVKVSVDSFSAKGVDVKQDLSVVAEGEAAIALQTKAGQMLNARRTLVTVPKDGVKNFEFTGNIDQSAFPTGDGAAALRPTYSMNLHFTAVK
ncbi:hypothetical protein [Candidatus Enterococcus courvalinii]|uniref:WxL domain-containing protein n=1 Tax=Candidatus Enterococcus courvalinii TaxID=2815329 RepID=A0ABS3I2Z8_9ENTE|nr:hypothetical protein [Enterococcus sp. MSG2901]MBO0482458.1 hypothetical protein [Enterococcus sp. MSG2901]